MGATKLNCSLKFIKATFSATLREYFLKDKAAHHQNAGPTMHRWRFNTSDSDRHTWLPWRRRQGCKPADLDTAGEPHTEQGRQSKVRHCTACAVSHLGCSHHCCSDPDDVQDSQVNSAACPSSSV